MDPEYSPHPLFNIPTDVSGSIDIIPREIEYTTSTANQTQVICMAGNHVANKGLNPPIQILAVKFPGMAGKVGGVSPSSFCANSQADDDRLARIGFKNRC